MASGSAVPAFKADWKHCAGCFCCNSYLKKPDGCCADDLTCCCCGTVAQCCQPLETHFPFCTILPGCVCLPTFGCCVTPRKLGEKNPEIKAALEKLGRKADGIICQGCCLGPCGNACYCYPKKPDTCCYAPGSTMCCCVGSDQALPFTPDVPKACGTMGLICFPKVGCCKALSALEYITIVGGGEKVSPQ